MGKTLKYVSEFTFPSSNSKPMTTGYAKGGMAMGGMKATKPAASPAPKSSMLYSKAENTAKTLLSDGKGAPMPHAKGSVNMAKGGKVKMAVGGPAMSPGQAAMARVQASRQAPQAQPTQAQPMTNVKPAMPGMGNQPQVSQPVMLPGNRPQVSQPLMPGRAGAADEMRTAVMKRGGMVKGGMSKVGKVMGEYKAGELHSGSKNGPVVKSRKQAVAIGMSEARKASKK